MAHFEAFFDEPLEFSEAVDDCIRLVWMRRGAGEDLVDPGVIPTDAVEKDRGTPPLIRLGMARISAAP